MKQTNQKGFTLAELLVVVAIIAVLVAVSIPIFTSQVEKAKASTDMANVRAAKAAAVADYLSDAKSTTVIYYYDAGKGTVTTDSTAAAQIKGYGKSSKDLADDNASGIPNENGTAHIVSISIAEDGTATASWISGSGGTNKPISDLSTTDWSSLIQDAQYGVDIKAGTLISEGNNKYLFYSNNNWYTGDLRNTVLSNSYTTGVFAGKVEKIDNTTSVVSVTDHISNTVVKAGTIASYSGKYYVLKQTMNYSDYNTNPSADENWALLSGQQ